MRRQISIGLALAISCATVAADPTVADPSRASESGEGLPPAVDTVTLGAKYFEAICLPSIGRPSALRQLAEAAGFRPLTTEQFEKVKTPDGVEGWIRSAGQDYVIVEYSERNNVGCSIYMSRANEADIRQHVSRVAVDFERRGSTVKLVHDDLITNRGAVPFRVLHYEVASSANGVSALGALVSERPIRGQQGAFTLLSSLKPKGNETGQPVATSGGVPPSTSASDQEADRAAVRCPYQVKPTIPPSLLRDPTFKRASVKAQVEMVPPGEIRAVIITSSSGFPALDGAVFDAMMRMRCEFQRPLTRRTLAEQTFDFSVE